MPMGIIGIPIIEKRGSHPGDIMFGAIMLGDPIGGMPCIPGDICEPLPVGMLGMPWKVLPPMGGLVGPAGEG